MKVSTLIGVVSISIGFVGNSYAITPYANMSTNQKEAVHLSSLCSVALETFSNKIAKNSDLKNRALKISREFYDLTVQFVGEKDTRALIYIARESIIDQSRSDRQSGDTVKNISNGCLDFLETLK